ncbi:MAG: serine/threonine-protein kinase [Acidobacteria bacterium]|nr:serine/threonine-protein kinase [Acidobacteriota bacterium]
MQPDRWADANRLFHAALDRPSEDRDAFLDEACAEDAALRDEVATLLVFHDRADAFLDAAAIDQAVEGQQVGPYRLVREVGRGGMGVVYLAEDTRLGRMVALKALPAAWAGDPARRERLRHEARAAAMLSHPGVATIYALEEIDGRLHLVSEFVRGETLREELLHGPVPLPVVIETGLGLAEALAAAHDRGVVHRDLKPENVLRATDGRVKIVDFGVAGLGPSPDGRPASGTPAYMSPEQRRGERVDYRSDLYALGIVLHELACGVHPFAASEERVPLDIPGPHAAALDAVIARCLAENPADRYQVTDDIVADLTAASPRPGLGAAHAIPAAAAPSAGVSTALWWWQFHQIFITAGYGVLLYFLWLTRPWSTSPMGQSLIFVAVVGALGAGILRVHLWFTLRSFPDDWFGQRQRAGMWIRLADAALGVTALAAGVMYGAEHPRAGALFVGSAVAILVAFAIIEPATTRAAARQFEPPAR